MKAIKLIIFVSFILSFSQCKKEKKSEPKYSLLENGNYGFLLDFGNRSVASKQYYLKDNFFYPIGKSIDYKDTTCFGRKAGDLIQVENNNIAIYPIQMIVSDFDPCYFYTDLIGGDTFVLHFINITQFTDQNSKKGLKGDFYYLVPSGLPYSKLEGNFLFGKY